MNNGLRHIRQAAETLPAEDPRFWLVIAGHGVLVALILGKKDRLFAWVSWEDIVSSIHNPVLLEGRKLALLAKSREAA